MSSASQCATSILRTLNDAGFESYLAGGCVRDMLLKKPPKDYDIATSAHPESVRKLFTHTKAIGKAFGVVQVRIGKHTFEIATFRKDSRYCDGRHPSSVTFSSAREDAMRRDFTVNAIFCDPVSKTFIDYCGGIPDLKKKIIRCVGSPAKRFREDHLRMLRAVRFSQTLGFTIAPDTRRAIRANSRLITAIAAERIRDELLRILTEADCPGKALHDLENLGLLEQILPLTAQSCSTAQLRAIAASLKRLRHNHADTILVALLRRTGIAQGKRVTKASLPRIAENARTEMESLRIPKRSVRHVLSSLMLYWQIRLSRQGIPREILPLLAIPQADTAKALLTATTPGRAVALGRTMNRVRNFMSAKPITGNDLKEMGILAGPKMKNILDEARILQAEGMKRNEILKRIRLS